jgi:hypothetical protein
MPGSPILPVVDEAGMRCFNVIIHGSDDEVARITSALPEVCASLRDPELRKYLTTHQALLDEADRGAFAQGSWADYLDPLKVGAGTTADLDHVSFHVVAEDIGTPGLSEICVNRQAIVRALAVDRGWRLRGERTFGAEANLVNTIAHELMHLHSRNPKDKDGLCYDLFEDGGASKATMCRRVSYVVGNAVECSYRARKKDPKWKGWASCMAAQADETPGPQGGTSADRDALGCMP